MYRIVNGEIVISIDISKYNGQAEARSHCTASIHSSTKNKKLHYKMLNSPITSVLSYIIFAPSWTCRQPSSSVIHTWLYATVRGGSSLKVLSEDHALADLSCTFQHGYLPFPNIISVCSLPVSYIENSGSFQKSIYSVSFSEYDGKDFYFEKRLVNPFATMRLVLFDSIDIEAFHRNDFGTIVHIHNKKSITYVHRWVCGISNEVWEGQEQQVWWSVGRQVTVSLLLPVPPLPHPLNPATGHTFYFTLFIWLQYNLWH